jgi:hypothetical protein
LYVPGRWRVLPSWGAEVKPDMIQQLDGFSNSH